MKSLVLVSAVLFSQISSAQKLFNKIEKQDVGYISSYCKGTLKSDELFAEKEGTSGDSTVKFTFSVIEWSAIKNCLSCLKELINNKEKLTSHLNVQEEIDKSLAHSVTNNNPEMFDYLLNNKADINHLCGSCHNQPSVQVALTYNHYDLFFRLHKLGANLQVLNNNKQNLIHTLLASYDDTKLHPGITDINATKASDVAKHIIDTLIKYKVDINAPGYHGAKSIMYAAMSNNPELYDYVKAKGATYDKTNPKETISLLCFSMFYTTEEKPNVPNNNMFGKVIKEEGITLSKKWIETQDLDGELLLVNAAKANNEEAFNILMKYKPDVNLLNLDGYFALFWAVNNYNSAMCETLLNANAKVDEATIKLAKKTFKGNKELIKKFEAAQKF